MSAIPFDAPSHAASLPAALPDDLLHGLALRPPEVLWDGARYRGSVLQRVQLAEVRAQAGVVAAVQRTHFAGVVAVTPLYARQAAAALAPVWQRLTPGASSPASDADADVDAVADADALLYALQPPQSEPPAGAGVVAWSVNGHTRVWLPACKAATLALIRRELAVLLMQQDAAITVTADGDGARVIATDALHPLDLMDAAADAALLSQAVGRPVCVPCQSRAADELVLRVSQAKVSVASDVGSDGESEVGSAVGSGLGSGVGSDVAASSAADSASARAAMSPSAHAADALANVWASDAPWAVRPSLARMLSQPGQANASAHATARSDAPIAFGKRAAAPLHASVEALNAAQVFAQESLWHEQALAVNEDPVQWRLRHLPEGRARDLAQQVVEQAGLPAADPPPAQAGVLRGTGFATAQVQCTDESGAARTVWSAWVAEVAVQPQTGHVDVTRVVAGHDSQHLHAAHSAPVRAEIESQSPWLLENARRLLAAPPAFDDWSSPAWQGADDSSGALSPYETAHALSRREPAGDVVTQGQLDVDGVVTLPAAAAIANAIHHATGVRLRQAPFDAESLRVALAGRRPARNALSRARKWLAAGAAGLAGLAGLAVTLWPMKPALPLTAGPDVSLYSMRAIERGRLVAAAGDCMVCHTAPGGKTNAGGLALDTPFGTIYTTNITPDNDTGIGRWSYTAFERAMRQGVHQDGRQLYPAFPYTAYAKLSDADMQALYGYLMSQPAVKSEPPKTQLAFPFNMRPLLVGWNALFHDATPFTPDPSRSAQWLRGAYLVEGAGHCAACHSPRNAFGAEKTGVHYLAGGEAEGWTAPALNQLASGPRAWSSDTLFQYLRTGYSTQHGVAAGPMAPVIHGLAELPDSDVRAITTYLLDLPKAGRSPAVAVGDSTASAEIPGASAKMPAASTEIPTASAEIPAAATIHALQGRRANGERIYQNACAACHDAGSGPTLFGARPLLSANTNVHAATPDNLIQVILNGIQEPADDALGYMPGFKDSLNDQQVADLVGYLRERHAPQEPAWPDPTATIKRLREHAELH
ncbi:c-type cytochrome [Achromobacter sp. NPDC008082]|uniref:c-type cytochrome n=1 Tax=Achromobacter sp. NPDC008082 TaxID=3363888 RepID=UPI0036EB24DE